jgi:hypothetical protein
VRKAAEEHAKPLQARGLLLDDEARAFVKTGLSVSLAIVVGIALVRLAQAFSRGQGQRLLPHPPHGDRRRGPAGDLAPPHDGDGAPGAHVPAQAGRRGRGAQRLRRGGETNEALLYAALFGVLALPSTSFGFVQELYPRPQPSSDGGSSGGDGGRRQRRRRMWRRRRLRRMRRMSARDRSAWDGAASSAQRCSSAWRRSTSRR